MKSSFQAGVDTLYNKCVSCGSTPSNKTPTAISNSIQSIYTDRYDEGKNSGVNISGKRSIIYMNKYGGGRGAATINTFGVSSITLTFSYGKWRVGLLKSLPPIGVYGDSFINSCISTSSYGYSERYNKAFSHNEKITLSSSGFEGVWLSQEQDSTHGLVHVVYN